MNQIHIRKSTLADFPTIMSVYNSARVFMAGNHYMSYNPVQEVCILFTYINGSDSTYSVIKVDWLTNDQYGTIHQFASSRVRKVGVQKTWNYSSGRK